MYYIGRVNTPAMPHYEQALADMAVIIEADSFWKKSDRPYVGKGTLMLAMGSHGGRGLYLVGISTTDNKWEDSGDTGSYRNRLPVIWQPVVYRHPAESVDAIANMITGFNYRFGKYNPNQHEFRKVLDFVLTGTLVDPWQEQAA